MLERSQECQQTSPTVQDKMNKSHSEPRDGIEAANTNVTVSNSKSSTRGIYEFFPSTLSTPKDQQFPNNLKLLEHPDIWVADTGATVHVTSKEEGIDNAESCDVAVKVGNGKIAESTFKGSLRFDACDRTGTMIGRDILSKVHVVPETPFNLCNNW
jgi:hypothetical protein